MKKTLIGVFLVWFTFAASAQEEKKDESADKPCTCCTEEYKAFDFWVGDWNTYGPKGNLLGTNYITYMQDNCVIQENWKSAGFGFTGTSYNFYDAGAGEWVQVWVDNNGGNLLLRGGIKEGSMVLESEATPRPQGGSSYNRITWTPNDDGTVRQLWETSTDYGASWSVLFDGLYKKKTSEK